MQCNRKKEEEEEEGEEEEERNVSVDSLFESFCLD